MTEFSAPSPEFLTPDECAAVDQALLSAREKFSARVAIYSLRSLKQIALDTGNTLETIPPEEVAAWVQRDRTLESGLEIDPSFVTFFTQLVVSSLKPLRQIAQENRGAIADVTVPQVIAWFEQEAKRRVEQGQKATFLG